MIGSLISAGATLLGGLFGSKKQKTENSVDYQKMARNATAAGFNPLTALRNGGSAGFTTTTGPTLSALPEALASMGGILGGALENKLDPLKQKQRQYDTALVDYQLRQLKEGPRAGGTLYSGGQYTGTKVTVAKPSMSGGDKATSLTIPAYLDSQKPTHTDPWAWTGGLMQADPNRADGEAYETAYGDFMGGLVGGVIPPAQDAWYNIKRAYEAARKKQEGGQWIRTRPIIKAERKAIDESWLPSWVPRFSYK